MKTDQYKQIARAIIMVCGIDAARDLDYDLSCFGARSNLHGATKAGLHNALREGIYEYGAQNKKAKTPRPITQQHLSNELRKLASNAAHCERVIADAQKTLAGCRSAAATLEARAKESPSPLAVKMARGDMDDPGERDFLCACGKAQKNKRPLVVKFEDGQVLWFCKNPCVQKEFKRRAKGGKK